MNIKNLIFIILLVFLGLLFFIVNGVSNTHTIKANVISIAKNKSIIYIVYSPTCPHCQHLLETLSKINTTGLYIYKTTDYKRIEECLKKYNFSWNYGVPLVFAYVNNSLVVISGFPASSQDINGYFMGKDFEMRLCKEYGGKLVIINGTYRFCKIKNYILGNKYAIEYLINICKKYKCLAIC